jgi:hypothetical protein
MSKMILALLLIMFLILRGCEQRPQECRDVIDVPREQGYAKFRSYPLEKQLDVYLCAMHVEPPDIGLADEIAERGDSAIPPVIQKLKTAERNRSGGSYLPVRSNVRPWIASWPKRRDRGYHSSDRQHENQPGETTQRRKVEEDRDS